MKIRELAAELAKFDPEMEVCVQGYEYGYQSIEPDDIVLMELALSVREREFGGEHDEFNHYEHGSNRKTCLVLNR